MSEPVNSARERSLPSPLERPAFRWLWYAGVAGALADGVSVAVIARRVAPHLEHWGLRLGLAVVFFLAPRLLTILLGLLPPVRSLFRTWNATGVLVVGFFLRAGFVLLLALAETLRLLCAVAFGLGCLSAIGAAAAGFLLGRIVRREERPRARVLHAAGSGLAGLAGVTGGILLAGGVSAPACFYVAGLLCLAAAMLGSGVGRVTG